MTSVKVAFFPGKIYDVNLDAPTSVSAVLNAINVTVETCMQMTINGSVVNMDTIVCDGQKIVITKMVKGNSITATVVKFPGTSQQVGLGDGATVQNAIDIAGFDTTGFDVKINGATADLSSIVIDGSRIVLVKKVKGN